MAKFIEIRGRLINIDSFIYIEEIEDYEDIYRPETREVERRYFNSLRLFFTKHSYIKVSDFTLKELERLMNQ